MPLKSYVGLPRHGKTYEVVVNGILSALRQGRRVVSNIAGLNYEAMCQLLYAEGIPQEKIGALVPVPHAQVEDPLFWRTDEDEGKGIDAFIQPGDFVALDEIWRFFKKRGDIHPRAMNFFRMHGHFTHPETGFCCEVALISQSVNDVNENIKAVVEETYKMVKNTKLGSDKSYIVHVFQQGSVYKKDFIRTLPPRIYQDKYFPLYKSHSQRKEGDAEAVEKSPDKRGSILQGPLFKFGIPFMVILFGLGSFGLYRILHPKNLKKEEQAKEQKAQPAEQAQPAKPADNVSHDWRLVGYLVSRNGIIVSLADASGNIRYLDNPPSLKFSPMQLEVVLPDGSIATTWGLHQNDSSVLPH